MNPLKNFFITYRKKIVICGIALFALHIMLWSQILFQKSGDKDLRVYFLNVGQGDATLALLPHGVKLLIDGGPPNGRLLRELEKILPATDRYIDLMMMSHPQLDHFGGFVELLRRYRVGALLTTGRAGEVSAFYDLEKAIAENNVRVIHVARGDTLRYGESVGEIMNPNETFLKSKALNDTSLVMKLTSAHTTALFTADIGANIENMLRAVGFVDILKVPHHGSRFSSSASFLNAISPKVAVIEVGKNSYGHPTSQALERIEESGAKIYRTDKDGTVEIVSDGNTLKVFKNL